MYALRWCGREHLPLRLGRKGGEASACDPVGVGDELDSGAPVGRAGSDDSRITVELRRAGRPVDVVAMIG